MAIAVQVYAAVIDEGEEFQIEKYRTIITGEWRDEMVEKPNPPQLRIWGKLEGNDTVAVFPNHGNNMLCWQKM